MSTHPVFAGEHAPSGTLFRGNIAAPTTIQVLRDGRDVARYDGHFNAVVSVSAEGLLVYKDGYGRLKIVDLAGPLPQEAREIGKVAGNPIVRPDGRRVLTYASEAYPHRDAAGAAHAGLVEVDLTTGAARSVWSGSTAVEHGVSVKDRPPGGDPKMDALLRAVFGRAGPDQPLPFADVSLAPDGEHWALLDAHRIVLGRGGERLGAAGWQDEQLFPPNLAWDLEGGRVYVTGAPGIFAFSLRGEPLARWSGRWPREVVRRGKAKIEQERAPVTSPALRRGDDLLAVVRAREVLDRYGDRSTYGVFRFDPATLEPRGPVEGLPERRLPAGDSTLLTLADGGLAWVPREAPIWILPAGPTSRRSTPLVRVVGDDPPARLPAPDTAWYDAQVGSTGDLPGDLLAATPEARRSLARYLLEALESDGRFDALLDLDPDAFPPWADRVLGWDDEGLRRLRALSRASWRVARGASDAVVDALVEHLEARLPEIDELRLPLLAGVCTPRALERAAALGRRSSASKQVLREHHLDVPPEGPAVARYVVPYEEIVARKDAGEHAALPVDLPAEAVLVEPRGWTCAAAPRHITSLPLDRLAGDPLRASPVRAQPLLLSSCDACDEAIGGSYVLHAAGDDRLELQGVLDRRERPAGGGCEGQAPESAPKVLTLEPPAEERLWPARVVGRLGGLPRWWQHPEVPDCPSCGRLMFYVGFVAAGETRDDLADAGVFAFHCEGCGVAAQVVQIT